MILLRMLRAMGEAPVLEYRFAPHRLWKFDLALPARKIALEIEGGAWINGRHTRAGGYVKDLEKYNCAALMGWRLVRITPRDLETGRAVALLDAAICAQDAPGGAISLEAASALFPRPGRRLRAARGKGRPGITPRGRGLRSMGDT